MKRLVIELDDETHKKLKGIAVEENKSMRDIVFDLLQNWLKKKEKR